MHVYCVYPARPKSNKRKEKNYKLLLERAKRCVVLIVSKGVLYLITKDLNMKILGNSTHEVEHIDIMYFSNN